MVKKKYASGQDRPSRLFYSGDNLALGPR